MTGLELIHEDDRSLRARFAGVDLLTYEYRPTDAQVESPRPYLHPVRTLGGDLVTINRPHDHVWHKGIALSLPNVGPDNFWGGPTYIRDGGYQGLNNNGTMAHEAFDDLGLDADGRLRLTERLTWHTQAGLRLIEERRRLAVTVRPELAAWQLSFETTVNNVSGATIAIGSPTTEGRDNAGYGGLFWRGPRSFTGGTVTTPEGSGGDEFMGRRFPWLAFTGQHDEYDGSSTLLFRDSPSNFSYPSQWFVRSSFFGCVAPAPFFSEEYDLTEGEPLTLTHDVVVIDGAADKERLEALAELPWELEAGA